MVVTWATLATGLKAATWTWFGFKSFKLACKLGKSLNPVTRKEGKSEPMFQSGRVEKFYKNTSRKARPRYRRNKEKVLKMTKEIIEECLNIAIVSSSNNNNNMKWNVSESQEPLVETMMETDDKRINSLVMLNFSGCNKGGYSDCDCWMASLAASRNECDVSRASFSQENKKSNVHASLASSSQENEKCAVVIKELTTLWKNDSGGLASTQKKTVYSHSTPLKAVDCNPMLVTGFIRCTLSPIVKNLNSNMEKTVDCHHTTEKTVDCHPTLEKTVNYHPVLDKNVDWNTTMETTVDSLAMLETDVDCQPLLEETVDSCPVLVNVDSRPVLEKTVDYHPVLEKTVETDMDLSLTVDPVCVDTTSRSETKENWTTTGKEEPLNLAVLSQPKPTCKLCVFFAKNGKCYRANCKFSHIFEGSEKAVPSKNQLATPIQRKTFNQKPEAPNKDASSMPKGFFGKKIKKTVTPKSDSDEPTIKRPLAADNKTEDEIVEPPPDKISKLNTPQLESKTAANPNKNVPKDVAQHLKEKPVENPNNNVPKEFAQLLDEVAQERNTGANRAETHEEGDCEEEDDHTTLGVDVDTTPEKVVELKCKETTTDITVSTTEDFLTEDYQVEVLEEVFDEEEVINLEEDDDEVILVCIKGNSTFLNHTLPLINIKDEDDDDHEVITLSDDED